MWALAEKDLSLCAYIYTWIKYPRICEPHLKSQKKKKFGEVVGHSRIGGHFLSPYIKSNNPCPVRAIRHALVVLNILVLRQDAYKVVEKVVSKYYLKYQIALERPLKRPFSLVPASWWPTCMSTITFKIGFLFTLLVLFYWYVCLVMVTSIC